MNKKDLNRQMGEKHPLIPQFFQQYTEGRISRRDFLRGATLLGLSATVAACAAPAAETEMATEVAVEAGSVVRGGTLTSAMELQLIDHPARISWTQSSNVLRQVCEYLTITGPDNITRPYLLENWEASDDLKTWTFNLQKGVKFNNGDELTADDVIFTMGEWLNPDVGSSMLGLLAYLDGPESIEKVDDYTIRWNLNSEN